MLLAFLIAALAGCNAGSGSRPVSMNIWQTQMQEYVQGQANGDINALREVEIADGQPGFRAYSHDRPEQSKDIAGVLVGMHSNAGVNWYVYLVGDIDREAVVTMHLAAIALSSTGFVWRMGQDSPAPGGSASYRAHREKLWREKHGETSAEIEIPRLATGFPSAGDQFTMIASGDTITVRETASGATWTLTLSTPNGSSATPTRSN